MQGEGGRDSRLASPYCVCAKEEIGQSFVYQAYTASFAGVKATTGTMQRLLLLAHLSNHKVN